MSQKSLNSEPIEAELKALRPSVYTASATATLIAVMVFGAWQVSAAVRSGLEFPPTVLDFREGRMTGAIEKQIDHKLPARPWLIAVANSLRYKLTHGGGDQVRLGVDDWLYLTDEVRYYPDAAANQAARIALLSQTSQALDKLGVKLVVALVPDKARIYPQYLAEGHIPSFTQNRYAQALQALRAQGVITTDLLAPFAQGASSNKSPEPIYYRTDTHWNAQGAQLAAQAVAATVAAAGLSARLAEEATTFATQVSGPAAERPGDLIRLMGLSDIPNFGRPLPDNEAPVATQQTSADKAGGGLLGDTEAIPVTLTGTSYSLRGNFHGYLQQALSAKVLNTAKDGGGFLQAATDYFKDDAFKTSKPKVVVWELPERFLPAPLDKEGAWLKSVGLMP